MPVPALEAYAVRTISSALLQMPRGVTVLPGDVARAVAAGGAAEMLPQPLPWNLPPVGLAWLKGAWSTNVSLLLVALAGYLLCLFGARIITRTEIARVKELLRPQAPVAI